MSFLLDTDIKEICESIKDIVPNFEGKRILITGSNGFLGKYFASVFKLLNQDYLKNKCNVILMDNLIVPNQEDKSLYQDFVYINHNISQPLEYNLDNPIKIDYIINAAGIASPYWYDKLQMATIEVGVDGLRNMLDLSIDHGARLLFFSSSEVYGTPPDQFVPTKEDYVGQIPTLTKRSAYDISKLMGETLTYVYNNEGADAVIVRPFNFSGPGMSKNDRRVLPNFVSKFLDGQTVEIYGSGQQTRTLCYISDAIAGCLKVLVKGRKGEAYNIGNSNNEISMVDLYKRIYEISEYIENHSHGGFNYKLIPSPINYITEPLRRCPDITKAKTELDYEPNVDLNDIIYRFYNWAAIEYNK